MDDACNLAAQSSAAHRGQRGSSAGLVEVRVRDATYDRGHRRVREVSLIRAGLSSENLETRLCGLVTTDCRCSPDGGDEFHARKPRPFACIRCCHGLTMRRQRQARVAVEVSGDADAPSSERTSRDRGLLPPVVGLPDPVDTLLGSAVLTQDPAEPIIPVAGGRVVFSRVLRSRRRRVPRKPLVHP